jgi:hypothetical protein
MNSCCALLLMKRCAMSCGRAELQRAAAAAPAGAQLLGPLVEGAAKGKAGLGRLRNLAGGRPGAQPSWLPLPLLLLPLLAVHSPCCLPAGPALVTQSSTTGSAALPTCAAACPPTPAGSALGNLSLPLSNMTLPGRVVRRFSTRATSPGAPGPSPAGSPYTPPTGFTPGAAVKVGACAPSSWGCRQAGRLAAAAAPARAHRSTCALRHSRRAQARQPALGGLPHHCTGSGLDTARQPELL